MKTAPPSYAVVTPARNERGNLERLAASMLGQTHKPLTWVVVDDGSDDGTGEVATRLASDHPWIRVAMRAAETGELASGRREGRDLLAFRRGIEQLPERVDVVVKVDADTSFDPDYFERLMTRFAEQPDLGIAGGACYELENGDWVRRKVVATHPRGASRAYRWECLDAVMSLEPKMGWDGLDEVKAALQGYRSQAFSDLGFRHHRLVGGREKGRLRNGTAQGRASWYMGYRPSYLLLRTIYRMPRDRGAGGMIIGYLAAAIERKPRCPDRDVIRHVRHAQRLRTVMRDGAPR